MHSLFKVTKLVTVRRQGPRVPGSGPRPPAHLHSRLSGEVTEFPVPILPAACEAAMEGGSCCSVPGDYGHRK